MAGYGTRAIRTCTPRHRGHADPGQDALERRPLGRERARRGAHASAANPARRRGLLAVRALAWAIACG
jgi:hypothetical protein